MPLITFTVRTQGAVPGADQLGRRQFNNLLKEAWFATGRYWHTELRPKHFTQAGAAEYGYKPRKGEGSGVSSKEFFRSYTGRKQKQFHHTRPLVFTGELEAMSRTANIAATFKGVKVALTRANKANFHNPHSEIDMRDELTRVSREEESILAEVLDESLQHGFDSITQTTTIG